MTNFLTARWENLIMANYETDPAILVPYLPKGTELDYHNGKTYVSLVGFMFVNTKIFGLPIPGMGTFEEINLRFYVTRQENNKLKRGVVFINETVPYKTVAWLANKLYKEHYTAIPTRHDWQITGTKQIDYYWKIKNAWNHIKVSAALQSETMQVNSIEEFVFEHYYGYTKLSAAATSEYKVEHPRWRVNPVNDVDIHCDFEAFYGKNFKHLATQKPSSVMLAEGSAIAVKWKRRKL
jgi:uncharacterized protein